MNTSDILIHVHPELSVEDRTKVENGVKACAGVISACFDRHKHPHALTVVYDPDVIASKNILAAVQKFDRAASMVGL